jgi:hypothetical protein
LFLSQKSPKFATKTIIYLAEQSLKIQIYGLIKKKGRGNFLFATDFTRLGEQKTINKALERLVKEDSIIRISRGVYYYPKNDKVLGLGVLYPTLEDIAEGIAKRDKARIVPTGLYALNRFGISTQIPMNIVYLTDGSEHMLNLSNGTSILFKYTSPKNLAFKSQLAMLLTFAFKTIGKEKITQEILAHTKELLAKDDKSVIE